jgi:hypothetical protein
MAVKNNAGLDLCQPCSTSKNAHMTHTTSIIRQASRLNWESCRLGQKWVHQELDGTYLQARNGHELLVG